MVCNIIIIVEWLRIMPSFYNKENVLQQYEYHIMQYRKICMKTLATGVF